VGECPFSRFAGLAAVNLNRPMEAVRELRRCMSELRFKGLRRVPWLGEPPPTDRRDCLPYAVCVERGAPFFEQVGNTGRWVNTSIDLAAILLERDGIATVPGAAFGEDESVLALRLATSGLYGTAAEQHSAGAHEPRNTPLDRPEPAVPRPCRVRDCRLAAAFGKPSGHPGGARP